MASKPLYLKWQTQASNIIYIMRNAISVHLAIRWLRLALAQALDRLLLPLSDTQQGRDCSMTEMDTHDRINLTGPWAGFGFQPGHMFTPARRERRLGMGDPGPAAEVSNVVHMSRGPRRPKRG